MKGRCEMVWKVRWTRLSDKGSISFTQFGFVGKGPPAGEGEGKEGGEVP